MGNGIGWLFIDTPSYLLSISQPDASYQVSSQLAFFQFRRRIDFQDGRRLCGLLGFPIGMTLAIFDLQIITMLPTKFRVNWPFSSEEAKNRFSRRPPWPPSWISDRDNFSYFLSVSPQCFLPSLESIGFWV